MGASVGRSLAASSHEAGAGCPHCAVDVAVGDPVVVCQACGTVHHAACWQDRDGCGSYHCAPARRLDLAADRVGPVLTITAAEIDRAAPMGVGGRPHRAGAIAVGPDGRTRGAVGPSPGGRGPTRVKMSRLAIASLVCAIAGIPLFGLITGMVAVLLGVLALGAIHSGARRGIGLAVPGVLLGVVDVAGWAYLISIIPWAAVSPDAMFSDPPPDLASIQELDPPLQRAMRANVLIRRQHGMAVFGGIAIGSGVILRVDGGDALIVSNRHVVDAKFPSDNENTAEQLGGIGRLTVRILGQPDTEGQVIWMAPGRIDLALVRAPCSPSSLGQAAFAEKGRPMRVGEPVFAIGNPHDLGWSHTQGVISQFRSQAHDGRRIRVIQTQASINPGNSGGGLYDRDGYCLGINTWTADKSVSEGLGFAIALDTLFDLAPPPLAHIEAKPKDARPGPTRKPARPDPAGPPVIETGDQER